jgi:hypothetical protein
MAEMYPQVTQITQRGHGRNNQGCPGSRGARCLWIPKNRGIRAPEERNISGNGRASWAYISLRRSEIFFAIVVSINISSLRDERNLSLNECQLRGKTIHEIHEAGLV